MYNKCIIRIRVFMTLLSDTSRWKRLKKKTTSADVLMLLCWRRGWGRGGHLGRSFPPLLGHAQVLQAEAGLVALGTHSARLVVQGLGALCTDGLRRNKTV